MVVVENEQLSFGLSLLEGLKKISRAERARLTAYNPMNFKN